MYTYISLLIPKSKEKKIWEKGIAGAWANALGCHTTPNNVYSFQKLVSPRISFKKEHIFWRYLYNSIMYLNFCIEHSEEYSETRTPKPTSNSEELKLKTLEILKTYARIIVGQTVKIEYFWTKLHKTKIRNKIPACNWKVHTNAFINSEIWPTGSPERLCNRGCGEPYNTNHRYFLCKKLRKPWTQVIQSQTRNEVGIRFGIKIDNLKLLDILEEKAMIPD